MKKMNKDLGINEEGKFDPGLARARNRKVDIVDDSAGINQKGEYDPGLARSRRGNSQKLKMSADNTKVFNRDSTNQAVLEDPGLALSRGTISPSLIYAFKLRQRDVGWGYALAHLIPFVGLFYAFSRKTVTPILYQMASGLVFAFLSIAFTLNSQDPSSIVSVVQILSFISTPILSKIGIDNARKYAGYKLQNLEEISPSDSYNETVKETKIKSKIKSIDNNNQDRGIEFELNKVKDLLDRGVISESEYQAMRKKVLGI